MKQLVVLIHGMWSTPETLDQLAEVFTRQQFEVHCPALPGHLPKAQMGLEQLEELKSQSLRDYVNYMVEYVEGLQQAPIIVGHSMGGLIAQLVAQQVECQALITISSAPPAGINGWSWSVIKTFGRNLFRFPLWKQFTELKLKNIAYGIANSQSAEVHQQILESSTYESGKASFEIGMWFLFPHPPSRVISNKIRCPVLVIGGTQDKITPFAVQRKIAESYGDKCTLKALGGACHWTIADGNLALTEYEIFNWLNDINLREQEAV